MAVRALPLTYWTVSPRAGAWITGAAVIGVILWLMSPMLGGQLGAIDDHEIALMLGADHRLLPMQVPGIVADFVQADSGRWRPAYYTLRAVETMVFGEWAVGWHIVRAVALVASAGLVVFLARPLPLIALAALPLMLVAGSQAEAWYRLGPQESYAVPVLLGGLAMIGVRRWWPAVALLLCAGLMKESFAAVLPFAAGWLWWQNGRHWSAPLVALVGGMLTIVAFVAMAAIGGAYYGGERSVLSVTTVFTWYVVLLAPILAALTASSIAARRFAPLLCAVTLVAVEATIYGSPSVPLGGRYLFPAILAPLLILPHVLRSLSRGWAIMIGFALVLGAAPQIISEHAWAEHWAASSRTWHAHMVELRAYAGPIVVTHPPDVISEPAVAVERYLIGYAGTDGPCLEVIFDPGTSEGACPRVHLVSGRP